MILLLAALLGHNASSVQVIVGKMMDYLRATSDDVQKLDAVKRIHELAERFAPDMQWFLDTMDQVCLHSAIECTYI